MNADTLRAYRMRFQNEKKGEDVTEHVIRKDEDFRTVPNVSK